MVIIWAVCKSWDSEPQSTFRSIPIQVHHFHASYGQTQQYASVQNNHKEVFAHLVRGNSFFPCNRWVTRKKGGSLTSL